MLRVQAWELINNPEYCGQLTMEQFYKLLIEAGHSKEAAQEAASQRGWDRLSAGMVM